MEQQIKVTARGEFTQLARGLKDLKRDLDDVTKQVDKWADKGGVIGGNGEGLAALDLYRKRFLSTMEEVDKEFKRQNDAIDEMEAKMAKASGTEKRNLQDEIKQREKKLDILRQELMAMERLYGKRNTEVSSYTIKPPTSSGGSSPDPNALNDQVNKSFLGKLGGGLLTKGIGLGKGALALAGIGGIGAILSQAYNSAYEREVGSLDVTQRVRGSQGFNGSNTDVYDKMQEIGMADKMGYTGDQAAQFMDSYSRNAGVLSQSAMSNLMKFSRGYGLDLGETSYTTSNNQQMGGTSSPQKFADMIAASVGSSGMTPRILEVMETNNELLHTINTTLKDGQSTQILAYQTTLDRLGNQNGMSKLTGAQGAGIISGLNGIFSPDNDQWKWMGIRALQSYKPQKYGKMDLYGLETSFEDGLNNSDNLPAMMQYIKKMSGGNQSLEKRILQKWLQQGGYNATKQQVNDLYDVTGGMTAFDQDKMNGVVKQLQSGNSSAAYDNTRKNESGQDILDVEAQYKKALQGVGSEFLGAITSLKGTAATLMQSLVEGIDAFDKGFNSVEQGFNSWVDEMLKKLGVSKDTRDKVDSVISGAEGYVANNPIETAAGLYVTYKAGKKVYDWRKKKKPPGGGGDGAGGSGGASGGTGEAPSESMANAAEEVPDRVPTGVYDSDGKMIYKEAESAKPVASAAESAASTAAKSEGWLSKLGNFGKGALKWLGPVGDAMTADQALKWGADLGDWVFGHSKGDVKQKGGLFTNPFNVEKWDDNKAGIFGLYGGRMKPSDAEKTTDDNTKALQSEKTSVTKDKVEFSPSSYQKLGDNGYVAYDIFGGRLKPSDVEKMPTDIKDFKDKGDTHLQKMEDNQKSYLSDTEQKTSQTMDSIYSEHRGFKPFIQQLFQPAIDHLNSINLGGINVGAAGMAGGSTPWTGQYKDIINKAAQKYGMDPSMIAAVIQQESDFNPNATSKAGAQGLMQLMPSTAMGLGVTNPFDPEQNIMGGTKYLSDLFKKYGGDSVKALTAYNAGSGNVDKWVKNGLMGDIPFAESKAYAPAVLEKYKAITAMVNNNNNSNNQQSPASISGSSSTITVNLVMDQNAAQALSQQQVSAIEKIAKQVFETALKSKVQVNPSTTGW